MKQWAKNFEMPARTGFLQNYFALTLVVGIGVLVILISFTISVHHQYKSELKTFETYRLDRHREIVNHLKFSEKQFILSYEALAEISYDNTDFLRRRLAGSPYSCIMVVRVDPATLAFERELILKGHGEEEDSCRYYNSSILNDAIRVQNSDQIFSKTVFSVPEGTSITMAQKMDQHHRYLLASIPVRNLITQHVDSPIDADIVAVSRVSSLDPRYGRLDDTNMYIYASEHFFNEVIHIRYLLRGKEAAIQMGWAWLILLLGSVILGLVTFIIYSLIRQNLRVREEVQKTTQSLREATDDAIEANETKSRFLASISHEIRTPLNLIVGMSELLSDTPMNAEQKEYIATFNKASQHLLELMNDILDMAMVESGEIHLRETPLEVENLIESVSDLIAPACRKKKIIYNHIIMPEVPVCIYTDGKRLKQILINLLNNALKYTERGEIQLHVRMEKTPSTAVSRIAFDVVDTGFGIPPAQLGRIFEAFYQLETPSLKKEGVGLGLALVRSYSKLLGGEVRVESREGKGSTFSVFLKLKLDTQDSWLMSYKLSPQSAGVTGPSVLLYSKNAIQEKYIMQSLNWIGFNVIVVDSYPQVVRELGPSGKAYSKVILDLSVGAADNSDQDLTEACKLMDLRSEDLILILPIGQSKAEKSSTWSSGIGTILFAPIKMKALVQALAGQSPSAGITSSSCGVEDKNEPASYQGGRLSFSSSAKDDRCFLVVEDDIDSHFLFQSYLTGEKLNVVYMADPLEALNYFKTDPRRVRAILTDLQMPAMDGRTFIKKIRDFETELHLPRTPIVVLTGESPEHLNEYVFMEEITNYLVKPIRRKQLIDMIQTLNRQDKAPDQPGAT